MEWTKDFLKPKEEDSGEGQEVGMEEGMSRVLQCSVLVPLMFLTYINDLVKNVNSY